MQYTLQVLELFYRSENEAMRRTLEIHSPDFIDSLTSYADFLQEEIKKRTGKTIEVMVYGRNQQEIKCKQAM